MERVENAPPLARPRRDLVELALQLRRERVVEEIAEVAHQPRHRSIAQRGRDQVAPARLHVSALEQHVDGLCVGRRPADAALLELADQRRPA